MKKHIALIVIVLLGFSCAWSKQRKASPYSVQAVFGAKPKYSLNHLTVQMVNPFSDPALISTIENSIIPWSVSPNVQLGLDECVGKTLPPGGTCNLTFSFMPTADTSYSTYMMYRVNVPGDMTRDSAYDVSATGGTLLNQYSATGNPPPQENQINKCGSIIDVDSQTLREQIPIVGTDMFLAYSSTYAKSYKSFFNSVFRIRYFNPEGFSLSHHHYFDTQTHQLYLGDGTSRQTKFRIVSGFNYLVINGSEAYVFDSSGIHRQTKTSLTGVTKYNFTYTNNRLTSITDGFGNQTSLNRNSAGVLTSIVAPSGQITTVNTNTSNLISSIVSPGGATHSFDYHSGTELLSSYTKPGGQVSHFTYDSKGKLTKDLSNGGNFFQYVSAEYPTYRTVNETTALSRGTYHEFWGDEYGTNYRWTVEPSGQKRETGVGVEDYYDWTPQEQYSEWNMDDERFGSASRRPWSTGLKKDGVWSYTDISQNVVGLNPSDVFSFTSITKEEYTSGRASTSTFTSANKTLVKSSPSGATATTVFDGHERPSQYKVGDDIAWTYTYDSTGKLAEISQGGKNSLTNTYNSSGWLQKATDILGREISFDYDLDGRVTHTTLPNGKVIQTAYDANGKVAGITPPGRPEHLFSFNAMELISAYQPPGLSSLSVKDTLYSYNSDKQPTNILRPDGQSVAFNYNPTTGLLSETQLSRGNNLFEYKAETSLVSQITSMDGIKSKFSYYGRTLSGEEQSRAMDGYLYGKILFTFDGDHRPISRVLRGHSVASISTINIGYTEDKVTQMGDMTLQYLFPSGRIGTTTLQNVSDSRTYDIYGNLESYTSSYNPSGGTPQALYSYSLTRDNASRIVGKVETVLGVTSIYAYEYDSVGRLSEVKKDGIVVSSYLYDDNGNRLSGKHGTYNFVATYDNQDRLLTYNSRVYSYNANGDNTHIQWNTTQQSSFSYDALGSLIAATNKDGRVLAFKYDGNSRLVQTDVDSSTTTRRIYENDLRIAAQYTNGGNDVKEFIYATNSNSPDYMIYQGNKYRFIKDHLGSPRIIVNVSDGTIAQRLEYTDLGKIILNTNTSFQPYAFAGGINENYTRLLKFGARMYDPEVGRWTTKDPIGFSGGDSNLYAYVGSDPINVVDEKGTGPVGGGVICAALEAFNGFYNAGKFIIDNNKLTEEYQAKIEKVRNNGSGDCPENDEQISQLQLEFIKKQKALIQSYLTPDLDTQLLIGAACIAALVMTPL